MSIDFDALFPKARQGRRPDRRVVRLRQPYDVSKRENVTDDDGVMARWRPGLERLQILTLRPAHGCFH